MLIEFRKVLSKYIRPSKLGIDHEYAKTQTVVVLRCDNCGGVFERPQSKMSPKRRSNSYFHVCDNCDKKRFAQRKGAERRTIWDRPASSNDDISKL